MGGKAVVQVSESEPQNYEEILEKLGGFGRFQALVVFLILFFEIPTAFVVFIQIFTGHFTGEWACDDAVVTQAEACVCNGTLTAPPTSFVAEWGLICGSAWVSDFIMSLQMAGMIFGNLYAGQASDWYGRRFTTIGVVGLMALGSCASALAPNPYVYAVARFVCGAGFAGYLGVATVYVVEFMPAKWRPVGGSCGPYGEATMVMALLAYFVRPWRTLMWITSVPYLFIFVIFPFVPESPRWFLQKGRTDDLAKVLGYMCKVNGKPPLDKAVLERIVASECPAEKMGDNDDGSVPKKEERVSYTVFFKRGMRLKTICVMSIYFSWSLIYFGLSFNIKNMAGDLYWNVVYLGITDAVGFPFALLILNRFGRRVSAILSISVAAFFLVTLAILQLSLDMTQFPTLTVAVALSGKFGVSVARSCIRALSSEAFPTSIRAMGSCLCGISASVAGVISAQLAYLGSTNPSVPFFTFAVIGVAGSLSALLLPETNGQPLQESIQRRRSRALSIISTISNMVLKQKRSKGNTVENKF